MVIGIIGASISGLIAGKKLAKAGHNVTLIERSHSLGGKLATKKLGDLYLDYGVSHFSVQNKKFRHFIEELKWKGAVEEWTKEFNFFDENGFHETNPHSELVNSFTGTRGMQTIVKDMSRWVDILSDVKAGGLTYIGPDRTRKRSWIINLTDISVFECDAVIVAAPAVEAYGILQTTQDETPVRRINSVIDEILYDRCFSLVATYEEPVPNWKGIECENSSIRWIGNESSKQEGAQKAGLFIRSTTDFYRKNVGKDDKEIQKLLLEEAANIVDPWVMRPKSVYLHKWKYFEARNPINEYFMELEMEDGPLALVGDYFGGSSVENAFLSGYNLAEYWINKYSALAVK